MHLPEAADNILQVVHALQRLGLMDVVFVGGATVPPPYNHPCSRAIRAASTRLLAPSLPIASER